MFNADEWTAADLIVDAKARGFALNQRLLVDWVQKGLLAQPRRRPLGRGSAPAVWSDNQHHLLLLLAHKRPEVQRLAQLAVIPVALWLIWGDDYVPITQVRRALRTWAGRATTSSQHGLKPTVNELLRDLHDGRAPKQIRERVTDVLATLTSGARLDPTAQLQMLRDVLPEGGPPGSPYTADEYLTVINARIAGATPFATNTDETVFTDTDLIAARAIYRQSMADYKGRAQQSPESLDAHEVTRACLNLITVLGLQHQRNAEEAGP